MDKQWQHKISQVIDARKDEIYAFADDIYRHPESGFREFRTSKQVANLFRKMGLSVQELADIPGVKATLDTGRPGPGLALIGELDAIICSEHPDCDPQTGAVHACGHNAQLAALAGAVIGLVDSGIMAELSGKIHFIAVPAEEYIELAYREGLREKGVLRYLAGKPELLHRGFFDDVDLSIMIHVQATEEKIMLESSHNGLVAKQIRYIGKASHAGGNPHEGINALYAANLGLMAINSIRETFREASYIRVHPIMTKGGEIVNVIPADVRLETFVRGKTFDDIITANKKVDQALAGAAIAIGAGLEVEDLAGYFPVSMDKNLTAAAYTVAASLTGKQDIVTRGHGTGSTDLGDLSALMPVIETSVGGVNGGLHSASYRLVDPEISYLLGAKFLTGLAVELLSEQAACAQKVVNEYQPQFSRKEDYFAAVDKLFSHKSLNGKWQWD